MNRSRFFALLTATVVSLGLVGAPQAHATMFGQMGPLGARADHGLEMLGAYLGLVTGAVSGVGQARIGLGSPERDLGFQLSVEKASNSGPTAFGGQVDLKLALVHPSATNKNLHLGGDLSAHVDHTGGDYSVTDEGLVVMPGISYASGEGNGQVFSVWGGLGLAIEHLGTPSTVVTTALRRVQVSDSTTSASSTQTSGVFRAGAGYDFNKDLGIALEVNRGLRTGSETEFLVGVNFYGVANKK